MTGHPLTALLESRDRLAGGAWLSATVANLRRDASEIHAELEETVLAQIPAFTASHDLATLPELAAHGPRHLDEIVRLLEGGVVGDFAFVREHARQRAEHRFPLEAVLHAYRCRHKVFARRLREAASASAAPVESVREALAALADFTIEYTDAVSTIASSAYVEQVRLAGRRGR